MKVTIVYNILLSSHQNPAKTIGIFVLGIPPPPPGGEYCQNCPVNPTKITGTHNGTTMPREATRESICNLYTFWLPCQIADHFAI